MRILCRARRVGFTLRSGKKSKGFKQGWAWGTLTYGVKDPPGVGTDGGGQGQARL